MIQTTCGVVDVGDTVQFDHLTGMKIGVIKSIGNTLNSIAVSIYCTDISGGYTLVVPCYNITKIIPVEKAFTTTQEEIKKPARYNKKGKLECWDVVLDQEMDFLEGNILKYLWRYKEKNGVEDLKKARVYLDKLISEVEKK
jgi:hypothetical protein